MGINHKKSLPKAERASKNSAGASLMAGGWGDQMFEQTFKNLDDVLWKEAGCTTELDYTEQSSWMLFLKYLDDLEDERALKAELERKPYDFLMDKRHRWSSWAAPKKKDGTFDHDTALTGDDLIDFVNAESTRTYSRICTGSSGARRALQLSNTKSERFSARSKTGFAAATACAMRLS